MFRDFKVCGSIYKQDFKGLLIALIVGVSAMFPKVIDVIKSVNLTERELVLSLKQKDEKAFGHLYDQYAPIIYGIILREVNNHDIASEILKSTFLNVINECDNIDCVKHSLLIWLLVMTKKTASANFKVNINFNSLLKSQQLSSSSVGYQNTSLRTCLS
ncbi:hypothetical protein [Segetibacter sp.]|uniref:RNA polymerase sigma factor n=1 Tax=Segetibacter sp. TaxID=2231182 RepID=UPI00262649E0|nr:hypothetical protein [Segetibacter sp.]